MARLLTDTDYARAVQSDSLAQIIESNSQIKLDVEQAAQAEMISYLTQRYIVNEIFTNTSTFSNSATYSAKNLVVYTETAFSASTAYLTGQRVSQGGNIYESIAGSSAHAFNVSEWNLICEDGLFFYAILPENEYNNTATYVVGDVVWYRNKIYTNILGCSGILPTNSQFWTENSTYSFTGQYPDDTTYWTQGDNRNQLVVMYLLDIALNHLHARINPRNIPDLRKERYDGNSPQQTGGAIGWLKRVAKGDINADLPEILPESGLTIRWGNANGDTTTFRNSNLW